jgi:hypothetical protein
MPANEFASGQDLLDVLTTISLGKPNGLVGVGLRFLQVYTCLPDLACLVKGG